MRRPISAAAPRSLAAAAVAVAALLATSALPATAAAATVTCGPDLQAAIDNAESGEIITIEAPEEGVCSGTSYTLPSRPPGFSTKLTGGGSGVTLSGAGSDPAHPRLFTGTDSGVVSMSNLTLRDSFSGAGQDGGALRLDGDSQIELFGVRFLANTASGSGGAVYTEPSGAPPLIFKSSFGSDVEGEGNSAGEDGGALAIENALADEGSALLIGSSGFLGNSAGRSGGGVAIHDGAGASRLSITDSTFDGNTAAVEGAGASVRLGGEVDLAYDHFLRNELTAGAEPARGAGLFAMATAPGLLLRQYSTVFDGNRVTRPAGLEFGAAGAGEWVGGFDLSSIFDRLTRNVLADRVGGPPVQGAGIALEGCGEAPPADRTARFVNLAVAGNTVGAGGDGAGMHLAACAGRNLDTTLIDATIAGNEAASDGGAAGLTGGAATDDSLAIRNSIVAGNRGGPDLTGWDPANRAVSFSDVCAPGVLAGSGNICADPRLVAPGPDAGDVHETQFSPTIDHGSNALVSPDAIFDFETDDRKIGPVVDMGADEYSAPIALTSSTRSVGPFGATVTGVVNANTHKTDYWFEFGRTRTYGRSTPRRTRFDLTGTLLASERLRGLRPDSRYHFRVVATNSSGTTVGMDHSFRTDPDPFGGAGIPERTIRLRNGSARILVTCPNGTPGGCSGKLTLRRPGREEPFGRARFELEKGHFTRVKVRIPKNVRAVLSRAGHLDVRAVTTAHDAYVTRKRRVTVRLER
jgi:hypothetical protein